MTSPTTPPSRVPTAPRPLALAAGLAGLEGIVLAGYGVAQLFALSGERATMVLTNSVFFLVYGVGLAVLGWLLAVRLRTWARAPVVLAQLLQLGVAWSFRGGPTTTLAVVLGVVALLVLSGIFHPASLRAVEAAQDDGSGDPT